MTRHSVPPRIWAEFAAAHNEFRKARGARRVRAMRLLEAAAGADEIEVDGVVVATVKDGPKGRTVRYIPPSAREQPEDQQQERKSA